jgi:hypothetical protein
MSNGESSAKYAGPELIGERHPAASGPAPHTPNGGGSPNSRNSSGPFTQTFYARRTAGKGIAKYRITRATALA